MRTSNNDLYLSNSLTFPSLLCEVRALRSSPPLREEDGRPHLLFLNYYDQMGTRTRRLPPPCPRALASPSGRSPEMRGPKPPGAAACRRRLPLSAARRGRAGSGTAVGSRPPGGAAGPAPAGRCGGARPLRSGRRALLPPARPSPAAPGRAAEPGGGGPAIARLRVRGRQGSRGSSEGKYRGVNGFSEMEADRPD